jgi:hypothetical protein
MSDLAMWRSGDLMRAVLVDCEYCSRTVTDHNLSPQISQYDEIAKSPNRQIAKLPHHQFLPQ